MPLLPYAKLVIESPLAPAEAAAALAEHVEPRRVVRWPGGAGLDFEGEAGDAVFAIRRIIGYRNSFLPEVRGWIEAAPGGSRIAVTMEPSGFIVVFGLAWIAFVVLAGISFARASLRAGTLLPGALIPPAMLVGLWAITAGGFTYEATRARRLLAQILRGRELT